MAGGSKRGTGRNAPGTKKTGAGPATGSKGRTGKAGSGRGGRGGSSTVAAAARSGSTVPWAMVAAVVAVLGLVGVIAFAVVPGFQDRSESQQAQEDVDGFAPSRDDPDPSDRIEGVQTADYEAGEHVSAVQRVAYDQVPPFGGPHDQIWATCTGTVYPDGLRTENAVHSLEHGAVWITWNPDTLPADQVTLLEGRVAGKPYMLASPYPGQPTPISLQSWGHQLQVETADDPRIDQFITALRINPTTHPEVGASCATAGPGVFDPASPPPFDPTPPGAGAIPMSGQGATRQGS